MRDPRFENWLNSQAVAFVYEPNVPIEKINAEASLRNQARLSLERLNESRVNLMALAIINGAELPAVIATEGRSGYLLIDGNHRLAATKQAGKALIDVYRITNVSDKYMLDRLTREANTVEGLGLTEDERLAHGMYLVATYGRTCKEVAMALNIPVSALENRLRVDKVRSRMSGLNLDPTPFNQGQLDVLGRLQNDNVLREAARLSEEASLAIPQIQELRDLVKTQRTEQDQLSMVRSYAAQPEILSRIQASKRGSAKNAPAYDPGIRALSALTRTRNVFTGALAEHLSYASDRQRERICDEWQVTKQAVEKVLDGIINRPTM